METIFKDTEFQALPQEQRSKILSNYFDKELSDDEFKTLPQEKQQMVIRNFIGANTAETKPIQNDSFDIGDFSKAENEIPIPEAPIKENFSTPKEKSLKEKITDYIDTHTGGTIDWNSPMYSDAIENAIKNEIGGIAKKAFIDTAKKAFIDTAGIVGGKGIKKAIEGFIEKESELSKVPETLRELQASADYITNITTPEMIQGTISEEQEAKNKEQLIKFRNLLKETVKPFGFEVGTDSGTGELLLRKDGKIIPQGAKFTDYIDTAKHEIMLGIGGGIAGAAKGTTPQTKLAGAAIGGLIGTAGGSIWDGIQAHIDLGKKIDWNRISARQTEAIAFELTAGVAGKAISSTLKAAKIPVTVFKEGLYKVISAGDLGSLEKTLAREGIDEKTIEELSDSISKYRTLSGAEAKIQESITVKAMNNMFDKVSNPERRKALVDTLMASPQGSKYINQAITKDIDAAVNLSKIINSTVDKTTSKIKALTPEATRKTLDNIGKNASKIQGKIKGIVKQVFGDEKVQIPLKMGKQSLGEAVEQMGERAGLQQTKDRLGAVNSFVNQNLDGMTAPQLIDLRHMLSKAARSAEGEDKILLHEFSNSMDDNIRTAMKKIGVSENDANKIYGALKESNNAFKQAMQAEDDISTYKSLLKGEMTPKEEQKTLAKLGHLVGGQYKRIANQIPKGEIKEFESSVLKAILKEGTFSPNAKAKAFDTEKLTPMLQQFRKNALSQDVKKQAELIENMTTVFNNDKDFQAVASKVAFPTEPAGLNPNPFGRVVYQLGARLHAVLSRWLPWGEGAAVYHQINRELGRARSMNSFFKAIKTNKKIPSKAREEIEKIGKQYENSRLTALKMADRQLAKQSIKQKALKTKEKNE